ncbi:hypothetical protein HJFPF1_09825 [Paramyrothecium foliicola]|nr:hypothetical protein HJFPF1_09825 [Paramyrothecium foliicola]
MDRATKLDGKAAMATPFPTRSPLVGSSALVGTTRGFPLEIWSEIFSHADHATRVNIVSTSKLLRAFLAPRLFAAVGFEGSGHDVYKMLHTFKSAPTTRRLVNVKDLIIDARIIPRSGQYVYVDGEITWQSQPAPRDLELMLRALSFIDPGALPQSPTLSIGEVALPVQIVSCISQMTALQHLTLDIKSFIPSQAQGFVRALGISDKWSIASLVIYGCKNVVFSTIGHCLQLSSLQTTLSRRNSSLAHVLSLQPELKRLHFVGEEPYVVNEFAVPPLNLGKLQDILSALPKLEWLSLFAREFLYSVEGGVQAFWVFYSGVDQIVSVLQKHPNIKRFAFTLDPTATIHFSLPNFGTVPLGPPFDAFDKGQDAVDCWYLDLLRRTIERLPHIEQFCIASTLPRMYKAARTMDLEVTLEALDWDEESQEFPFGNRGFLDLFGRLIHNGQWTETWEYVREVSPAAGQDESTALVAPNTVIESPDLRCGRNASNAWSQPKTATIRAGDTVGFAAGEPQLAGLPQPWMYHPGFASAWLSKAPNDDLDSYTGDGDWFKILNVVNRTEQSVDFTDPYYKPHSDPLRYPWGTFLASSWNFTIPSTTPAGKYLLRWEHIFPNPEDSQFFVNCAHVEILNDGDNIGTPGPLVKIPGVYQRGQKDVYFSSYSLVLGNGMTLGKFSPPKPEVWSG